MKEVIKYILCFGTFASINCNAQTHADTLAQALINRHNKQKFVVAHRGDWRNAPENSAKAMQNCINMGVDMIEIDLKMSKDSVLILMHDKTLDRTTNGKGLPSNYTWSELQTLRLKNGLGRVTNHAIPSLQDILTLCKGKILINIDKGYDYFSQVLPLLESNDATPYVVIKSGHMLSKVQTEYPDLLDKVIYMPVIALDKAEAPELLRQYLAIQPVAIECCFEKYTPQVDQLLTIIRTTNTKIWLNSLWPSLNAGHDDDMAVIEENPDGSWGWLLNQGAVIIQTDRPKELIDYLKQQQNSMQDTKYLNYNTK